MSATSGMALTCRMAAVAGSNTLPSTAVIFSSGSKLPKEEMTRSRKPLKTDSTQTSAVVATATLHTEIMEMMLMALCDFLASR